MVDESWWALFSVSVYSFGRCFLTMANLPPHTSWSLPRHKEYPLTFPTSRVIVTWPRWASEGERDALIPGDDDGDAHSVLYSLTHQPHKRDNKEMSWSRIGGKEEGCNVPIWYRPRPEQGWLFLSTLSIPSGRFIRLLAPWTRKNVLFHSFFLAHSTARQESEGVSELRSNSGVGGEKKIISTSGKWDSVKKTFWMTLEVICPKLKLALR